VTARETPALGDRSRRILATLVREYIDTGEPVASQVLVHRGGLGLSSATIRNVLAQLEELGYVQQPHTSAGRIPTDLGYRCFVDMLLQRPRALKTAASVSEQIRSQLAGASKAGVEPVLALVPHFLSEASHHVAFALAPGTEDAAFDRIDFLSLGNRRVLIVVLSRGGHESHKVVELDDEVSIADLQQAANYVNAEFSGMSLATVRAAIVERMGQDRMLYDKLLARALRLAQASFEQMSAQNPLFVEGAFSLLEEAAVPHSGITLTALSRLVRMIEEKHRLVRLLTQYIEGPGLMVVIGAEHADPNLRQFSLIASTYSDGLGTGTVGLIGPMRMHYSRAMSMVDGVARAVSDVLARPSRSGEESDS
jgi:heat-inducible transcriptional repressor